MQKVWAEAVADCCFDVGDVDVGNKLYIPAAVFESISVSNLSSSDTALVKWTGIGSHTTV